MRALLLALLVPLGAWAQYTGPALETCRAYGERELKRGGDAEALVFDQDGALLMEKYARKAGNQHVSSILSGNGAVRRRVGPAVELSFVCLLANDRRALFFFWTPRPQAPSLAQCRRSKDPADCLQLLLDLAERDLVGVSAFHFQSSIDADAAAGNDAASSAYRNAAGAWRNYRDLECVRRSAAGTDPWRACMVDLTRRRYLDLK
jgi:hypothetical protein